jgi:Ca2+-binding RTX toxin-like protein
MTKLTFNSAAGSDALTINNPAVGLFAPVGGIDYNGGGQVGDLLNLFGGGAADLVQTYFVGTTTPPIGIGPGNNGDGLLRFTGSSNVDIRFTGLAPIVDTVVAASLTVNSTDAGNMISVTNGVAPRLLVAVDAFETIEFNNKAQLIVNGGDGAVGGDAADTILVNFNNLPAGLTGIRINADEGADAVSLQASSNLPVTLNGGDGLDVINVGNNGTLGTPGLLTPVAGPVIVNGGAGGADLTVDGTGDAVAADYAITATTVTRSMPAGFGGVTYSNLTTLLLATGSGPNVVTVSSTSVPTTADANAGIDTLILNPTSSISIYEQAGNYNFDLGTPGGLTALDFENINLLPGNGVLNIVGDEGQGTSLGGAGVDDTDRVEVVGTAQNAGGLRLNNIAVPQIVLFAGVTNLNVNTFDLDDDVTLDPFASTTQAWNIVVNVNAGAGDDDIFYGNTSVLPVVDLAPNGSAAGVSENVTVTPTLNPGAGEIAVPGVVTIHFQETEDLSFLLNNGALGDSDTLTIRGTDNNLSDTFTIRPDAAGNDGDPLVDLDVNAVQLLQIENISAVAPGGAQFFVTAINFEGLGGSDTFDLLPGASGTILNIDGGNPTNNPLASDIIVIQGTAGFVDLFTVTPGATADAGAIASTINGTPRAAVSFKNLEGVNLNLGGGAAADVLTMQGTGANNAFTLVATAADSGTARVDAGPLVTFTGLGTAGSDINLVGLGGDDQFSVTHLANWQVEDVNIDGGAPSASDAFQLSGTAGVDAIAYTATSANSGLIDLTSGGPTTNYILTSVESALVDGLAAVDTLNVTTPNAVIVPGSNAGEGTVKPVDNVGGALLALSYRRIETVTVTGAVAVIQGTEENDTIRVSAAGIVTVTNSLGFNNVVDVSGFASLVINALGGSDNVTIDTTFAGPINVIGGTGINSLTVNGVAAVAELFVVTPDVTPGSGLITANTAVGYTGISHVSVFGNPNDSLVILDTAQNNTWTVGAAPLIGDRTQLDSRETVDYFGFNEVDLVATGGVDTFVIRPTGLTGSATPLVVFGGPGGSTNDRLVILGTAGNDAFVLNSNNGGVVGAQGTASLNGTSVIFGDMGAVELSGQAGNDNFDVTALATTAVMVDGSDPIGAIGDTLSLTVPAGAGTTTFVPGTENDEGGFSFTGAIQPVSFNNIEAVGPISLAAAGGVLIVCGTNAGDVMNVRGTGAAAARVSVNGGLEINYTGVTTLSVQGKSGDDVIHLTPGAFTGILNVAGDDPTASDKVVVTGTAGLDNVVIDTVVIDGARVTGLGPVINVSTTESLVYSGLGGNDTLTVTSPAGGGTIDFITGNVADAGSVLLSQGGGVSLLSVSYQGVGINGNIVLADAGGARADTLQFFATGLDDVVTVTAAGNIKAFNPAGGSSSFRTLRVQTPGVSSVILAGLDGDDVFNIPGNHPFTPTFGLPAIRVEGGNPSASDVLNFTSAGAAVTLNFGASSIVEAGFAPVVYTGIETVNIDANNTLTVTGTAGNDTFDVIPLTADFGGRFTHNLTPGVQFTYDDATTLTYEGGAGGVDVLNLFGDEVIDAVTATATTVTIDGSAVTIGTGIDALNVRGLGGDDTLNLTGFTNGGTTIPVGIYGGDGNDTIRGSNLADLIYGGMGNDILMGGVGADFVYGEDGNDIFGNPTLTADGVADDPGTDQNFGGPGFDNFIWEPGDGPDFNQGGDEGGDIFRFFGGDASADSFTLRAGGTPTHFNALIGALVIDNHGIEDVIVDGRGGADSFTVNDLFTTEVVNVNMVLGAADGAVDGVTVNGRNVADNLNLTTSGAGLASIQGLRYNVNLTSAEIGDLLTVNGNDGNDVISMGAGVEGVTRLTLNGNVGNDTLDVRNTVFNAAALLALNGGDDNDTLIGGLGNESLDGGGGDDTFTGNGGTDAIGGGAVGLIGDTILVPGTPGNDLITTTLNATGHLLVTINGVTTTYTNFVAGPISTAGVEKILVPGGLGFDSLTVDSTNGAIPTPITYDGGQDFDSLTLTGGTATSDIYSPGPNPGQGLSTIVIGGVTQTVSFTGLEPVIDLVAGPLVVNANHSDNAINYDQSPNNAAWGRVSIDTLETIEFSNKTTLTINALAGSDTINLNNSTTPTALTGITVNGGDPTASDELIVNGTTGNNNITYTTSDTIGSGTVAIVGSATVNFTTVESLTIDGQGGSDTLTHATPAGGHRNTFTPGTSPDSGTIRSSGFGAGTESVPLTFKHIGALGTVTIAGAGAATDILELNGTNYVDSFSLTGSNVQITNATGGFVTTLINTPGVFAIELRGRDGDDTFNVTGSLAAYIGSVVIDGGNPSASDVLNLSGATGAVAVNFMSSTTVTGYGATVTTSGVEILNANAGTNNFAVNGTTGDDTLDVTPTATNSATFRLTKSNPSIGSTPVVNGSQIGTLSVNLLAGSDTLVVNGTTAGEAITVTGALVTVGALETVNFLGAEALTVFAAQGADTITVTPGAIPVFIDGGDPIGVLPGDQLIVNAAVGFIAGPENDEGGVITGGGTVSFDHIESLAVAGIAGCPFLILGTNADDDITIIARDNSTTAGADGVQDMTFSINAGMSVVLLNQADLFIDAMAGDDDIVIRTAAPNEASWDVNVRVAGGSPSIGAPLEADRLVLETPNNAGGFDDVVFNPTGADTGNLVMDENANGVYDAGGTDSIITFGSFIFDCPPAAFTYTSTAGGVELIQYNGEGAPAVDDNLTINGTALDDTTILNPTGIGTGSFASGASPQFNFQSFDNLTVNPGAGGFDRVQINGTEGVDTVTSNANTVTLSGAVTIGAGIDQLDINTFGGNDNVDLDLAVTGLAKFINVGAGNDTVNLQGVAVDPADPTIYGGDGDDFIIGSPNPDSIFGGTGNDTLVGGAGADQIYGEEGNDILGNPSAIANGLADDAGNDFFNGGAGSDLIIWEPGDGSDIVEGGAGDADVLAFFGNAGAEVFNVFAKLSDPSRTILFRNLGNITIDMAGVDQINVQGNAGTDAYVVGRANNGDSGNVVAPTSPYVDPTASLSDLSTTEVRVVNIIEATDAPDNVFIDGRPTDDNLTVTVESALTGVVRIAGLPYDVRVSGTSTADRLTIRGNEGHDTIKAINSSAATVEGLIGITLAGGVGNDTLSADAILIGGNGDDFLAGGAGDDQLFGNDGEDTMVGGAGNDTFDGGAGFDTILVRGTLGNDAIDISQTADVTLVQTVNGVAETDTLVLNAGTRTVERVSVEASAGNDTIRVQWADSLGTDANINSLRVDVDGGAGTTADRLGVVDLGLGDLILFEHGTTDDSGAMAIGPGNTEPLIVNFTNVEVAQPVAGAGGDVVFFKHDEFEYNDARTLATYLGSGDAINVDPNINPGLDPIFGLPSDEDWFRVVAERTGVLDFQVYFRQVGPVASGRPGLPNSGNLDIAVTDAAGNVIAGFGVNDATSDERVRIPAVAGQTYYLRVFANLAAINTYSVTVDNYAPPVPRDMELLDNPVGDPPPANSDTGRSQFDNVTRDNTPTLVFRLDDGILLNDVQGNSPAGNSPPNGVVIPIPFQAAAGTAGYRIAIFDEGSSPAPGTQVGTAPQVPLGFATFVSPGVYQFTTPVLADGTHFLTARVQMVDPSTAQQTGFGDRSVALEIVVDTVIPVGFFGQVSLADTTQGLGAASDSGVVGNSSTFVDRVTNDTTPSFYGRAEANAIVRVYVETNGVAGLQSTGAGADLFLGLTVSDPLDGTNQFPGGQWSFTTPLDLNNPNLGFALDGARSIYMTAEDVAGNVTTDATADRLNIFLDTAGAQVTDVQITGSPLFNLFGLKPDNSIEGPTPRVDSLTIRVQDFPNRSNLDPNFLYAALQQAVATTPGNFVLKGDHTGIIAIQSITFIGDPTGNGAIATGSILLNFFAPLPDDRYTLTIKENVVDPVGNKLDGESNAAEPIGNPNFASGDGQPGGDFIARFTVDSRPEIGAISEGLIYVDINGNMVWDPEGQDNDATNRDFTFQFGQLVDAHFAGNFAATGAAAASGYDKLGAYGKFAGKYSFILDTNDDGVGDFSSLMPASYQVNGMPVAGDFNAAHPGDEIGLFDGSFWYLDTNGNNQIDLGERFASNFNGLPVVGDFNGDGNDDLAVFVNDTNRFIFDTNRDGNSDFTWNVADQLGRFGGLSGFTDRPVVGDLNLDGIDDIGLWTKDRQGTLPRDSGEYFFWVSDRVNANPANVFDSFSPAPLGNDLSAQFGDELALPIFGNFDPPVGTSVVDSNPLHRAPTPLDINGDGAISPIDALLVINVLNKFQGLPTNDPVRAYYTIGQVKADSSGDRGVTPLDALLVINALNRKSNLSGEGEGDASMGVEPYQAAADEFFAQLGDNSDLEILKKRRS